ncbi:MAG: hypothetical protein L6425_10045 [Candidatus Aminicenantes bacterium]|nr:hypothetical protein [Candidatus Aminicenantes bacterium]
MGSDYRVETIQTLTSFFSSQNLLRPHRIRRYDPGTELTYEATGVIPAVTGMIRLKITRYVGGGFAGQVYQVTVSDMDASLSEIPGLKKGGLYAIKILRPVSGFNRFIRNVMYALAFQGSFSLEGNPDAVRAGALWQKFIRRASGRRFGTESAVVDILATFTDDRLGSCGEISEWVEGRMWRFEVDNDLDSRRRYLKRKNTSHSGSSEYLSKRTFMSDLVSLFHEMGAHELARQYEWWTFKSQPNAMKRISSDPDTTKGHTAVDFRAGMALLPFAPQSPGDFRLIWRGLKRGSLVQFDRGDLHKLKAFISRNHPEFSDMESALVELEDRDRRYRQSLPDVTHHHIHLLTRKSLRSEIRSATITGWKIRGVIDSKTEDRLRKNRGLFAIAYFASIIPILGPGLRRLFGHSTARRHWGRLLTHPRYVLQTGRGRMAETLIRWHRSGRVGPRRAERLVRRPLLFYANFPFSLLPPGLHRFCTDKQRFKQTLFNVFVHPVRLYFRAEVREKWLRDMITTGERKGMLTPDEAAHIQVQVAEPFIQKYLKSLAVHVCTVPVTQIISVLVAFIYIRLHPELAWQQATIAAGLILGMFQVTPISPGSLVRGIYVTILVLREKNWKDYNIAFSLSFFKYIGYLAFPIQMAYRYPELARFMAGHWATGAVHLVPIFGERGALLEHAVFDLFYNFPLTIHRRLQERKKRRLALRPRLWHAPLFVFLGTLALVASDIVFFRLNGRIPALKDTWWFILIIPLVISGLISRGAGGASLGRRLFIGIFGGAVTALLYQICQSALLPAVLSLSPDPIPFMSLAGKTLLAALWKMFLFTFPAALGAVWMETRPVKL